MTKIQVWSMLAICGALGTDAILLTTIKCVLSISLCPLMIQIANAIPIAKEILSTGHYGYPEWSTPHLVYIYTRTHTHTHTHIHTHTHTHTHIHTHTHTHIIVHVH